jgi:hypothetical protein
VQRLEDSVAACDVLLAVIAPGWLDSRDETGRRRLDDPSDFVRVEIAAALRRNVLVIPVMIDGAAMPRIQDLPDELHPLVRRNAVDIRHTQFGGDADRLIAKLSATLGTTGWSPYRRPAVAGLIALALAAVYALFATGMLDRSGPDQKREPPPREASTAARSVLDFSAAEKATGPHYHVAAEPYLRSAVNPISVEDVSPAGSLIVLKNNLGLYEGRAVAPTVSQNFLTQIETGNVPSSFTLRLGRPVRSVTFVVPKVYPATESGITFPAWSATALSASGETLSSVSEALTRRFSDVPERRYTLRAPGFEGIGAVRFDSDPNLDGRPFAAFSAILIEEFSLDEP